MKKIIFTILLVLAFALSACGSALPASISTAAAIATQVAATSLASATSQTADTRSLNTSYTNGFPVEYKLLVGTLKLEGTDQSLTTDQAKVLLPLWQQVQSGRVLQNSRNTRLKNWTFDKKVRIEAQ